MGRSYPTTNQRNTKMIVIMMIMIIVIIIIINIVMSMGLPNTPSRSKHAGGNHPTHTTPQGGKGGNHHSPHPNHTTPQGGGKQPTTTPHHTTGGGGKQPTTTPHHRGVGEPLGRGGGGGGAAEPGSYIALILSPNMLICRLFQGGALLYLHSSNGSSKILGWRVQRFRRTPRTLNSYPVRPKA